ncbi:hypothetical protein ACLK17_25665 [Escherichia coli]
MSQNRYAATRAEIAQRLGFRSPTR